jgi:hypothetical protein
MKTQHLKAAGLLFMGACFSVNAVTITAQPQDVLVRVRPDPRAALTTNATFSIGATSENPPLTYQWRFNGTNIPGANSPTLVFTNVATNHYGSVTCAITDGVGTIFSASATLYPLVGPGFVQQPANVIVPTGALLRLSCVITGFPPPFSFQWRRGTTPLATNTVDSPTNHFIFIATNVPSTNAYRVVVKNLASPIPGVPSRVNTVVTQPDGYPMSFPMSLRLGNDVRAIGLSGSVPLIVDSSSVVRQLDFNVRVPPDYITNVTLTPIAQDRCTVTTFPGNATNFVYRVVCTDQPMFGTEEIARLSYLVLSNRSSIAPLEIINLTAYTPGASRVSTAAAHDGRVVVVGQEPMLETWKNTGGQPWLTLYGQTNRTYRITASTQVDKHPRSSWDLLWEIRLLELFEDRAVPDSGQPKMFFDAYEQR